MTIMQTHVFKFKIPEKFYDNQELYSKEKDRV